MINGEAKSAPKKRGRWDQTVDEALTPAKKKTLSVSTPSSATTPVWEGDVSRFSIISLLKEVFILIFVTFFFIRIFTFTENPSRHPLGRNPRS